TIRPERIASPQRQQGTSLPARSASKGMSLAGAAGWQKCSCPLSSRLAAHLDDDAAKFEQTVYAGKPHLAFPTQPAFGRHPAQFDAIVSAAVPQSAAHRPGQRVLG